ncbi:hypothetical protein J7F03_37255 [Streptomyces sp. ISL-43]|uniref:hypothetical protein n=1 Tax=Streptomyces sp. ISL-43 TaxID=2819183 RepID=UPI001BECEA31|nr:hypothetical protein [Streptomyces sp. ISL-43]MBT2452596.1 hypothetical protein [Streptomyces sp. ISL-43]
MDETLEVWPGEAAGKARATSGVLMLDKAVNGGTRRPTPAESARQADRPTGRGSSPGARPELGRAGFRLLRKR